MTPRECFAQQIERGFQGTLGCAEHEQIAAHILLDLCKMGKWDCWLSREWYAFVSGSQSYWNHAHCDGRAYHNCSFDRFVTFYDATQRRFKVNEYFIERMHFAEND